MAVTRRQAHENNKTTSPPDCATIFTAQIPNGGSGGLNGSSQQQQPHDHIVKHHQIPYVPGATPKVVKADTEPWVYMTLVVFAVITVVSFPVPLVAKHGDLPTLKRVFFYGWMTALCTGIGAVPFFFLPDVAEFWVGISNGECIVII
jgi:hypothetical protein